MAIALYGLLLLFTAVFAMDIMPPVFEEPTQKTTLYQNQVAKNVIIPCKAIADPKATYWWWKDSIPVAEKEGVIKINPATGDMTFDTYTDQNDGKYMCQASTKYKEGGIERNIAALSPVLTILMKRTGKEDKPLSFEQNEYSHVQIPCHINPTGYTGSFKWYRGKDTNQITDFDNGRLYIGVDNSLHFTHLKKSDQTAAGSEYRCGLVTDDSIVLGSSNTLKVNAVSSAGSVPHTLAVSNSGVQAMLYETAELECVFKGYDPSGKLPPVTWLDNRNRPIGETQNNKYKLSSLGRRLTINTVTEEDEGTYKCMIEGQTPEDVVLDVIAAPHFEMDSDRPLPMTVMPEGSDMTFNCMAISMPGDPPPESPKWYINAKAFDDTFPTQKYQLSGDSKQMTVLDLQKPADTLCVQCSVRNNYGVTWASGCVQVILSIDLTMRPPLKQEVEKGDIVDFTVIATKDPSVDKLTYIWSFNNDTYVDKLPPHVQVDATRQFINTSDLTWEQYKSIPGVYSLNIRSPFEQRTITTEVVLVDKAPVAAATAGDGFPMWIIIVIICIIILLLIILCIVCVVCRKKLEGDYNVDKKETGAGLNPQDELKAKGFDDFSRPQDYDEYDYPDKPRRDIPFEDDALVPDDADSEDEELFFNEDGSFIGQYHKKDLAKDRPKEPNESNI